MPGAIAACAMASSLPGLSDVGQHEPPHGYRDDREIQREVKAGLDLVFWVLIGALTVLIVARYR
jgi:hypothetical protein